VADHPTQTVALWNFFSPVQQHKVFSSPSATNGNVTINRKAQNTTSTHVGFVLYYSASPSDNSAAMKEPDR